MKAEMSFCLMAGPNEIIDPALPPAMVGRPVPVSVGRNVYEGLVTKAEPIRQDGRTIGIEVYAAFDLPAMYAAKYTEDDFSLDRPKP